LRHESERGIGPVQHLDCTPGWDLFDERWVVAMEAAGSGWAYW
jgi:hypothetical protein